MEIFYKDTYCLALDCKQYIYSINKISTSLKIIQYLNQILQKNLKLKLKIHIFGRQVF